MGPEALSFSEVTDRIGSAIGKRLMFQPISDEEARRRYSAVSGQKLKLRLTPRYGERFATDAWTVLQTLSSAFSGGSLSG
jgi:uncharacterized protein YbjT (DUF2867 family)